MAIFDRVKEILLSPKAAWESIKSEPDDIKNLMLNYAMPLALIPAVCQLIGITLIGVRVPSGALFRVPFLESIAAGIAGYIFSLAFIFVGAWIVNILAPSFESKPDYPSSIKVVAYSMTPMWLVGVFSLIPGLSILSILGLYGIYLLALSLPIIMGTPEGKVVWYTIATLLIGIVISFVLSVVLMGAFYAPLYMRMMSM